MQVNCLIGLPQFSAYPEYCADDADSADFVIGEKNRYIFPVVTEQDQFTWVLFNSFGHYGVIDAYGINRSVGNATL